MIKRLSSADVDQAVMWYQAGESSIDIAGKLGVSDVAIRVWLRKRGVARRGPSACHRVYTLNEGIFDEQTGATEYWLGMLITDGSVYQEKTKYSSPRLELGLAEIDKDHVVKFGRFMGSDAPTSLKVDRDGNRSWRWSARSARLAEALDDYGITKRKTFTASVDARLRLSKHFWRGVMDGDGELKDRGNFPGLRVLGTSILCGQFKTFCSRLVPLDRIFVAKIASVYYAEMNGNDSMRVIEHLYGGCDVACALARKKVKADDMIRKYQGRIFRELPPRRSKPTL